MTTSHTTATTAAVAWNRALPPPAPSAEPAILAPRRAVETGPAFVPGEYGSVAIEQASPTLASRRANALVAFSLPIDNPNSATKK